MNSYKEKYEKLKKIIQDYCYIDTFDSGEMIRMCCESDEKSNADDFKYLKSIIESEEK